MQKESVKKGFLSIRWQNIWTTWMQVIGISCIGMTNKFCCDKIKINTNDEKRWYKLELDVKKNPFLYSVGTLLAYKIA